MPDSAASTSTRDAVDHRLPRQALERAEDGDDLIADGPVTIPPVGSNERRCLIEPHRARQAKPPIGQSNRPGLHGFELVGHAAQKLRDHVLEGDQADDAVR